MKLQLTRIFAVLVSALAIMGLFANDHLFELMNVDPMLDIARIGLAGLLIYAGFISKSETALQTSLAVLSALYIGLGLAGLLSPTVGGLLPSGLTEFDTIFHLLTGALASWAAVRHGNRRMATHS